MKFNIEKLRQLKFFKSTFFLFIILTAFFVIILFSSIFLIPTMLNPSIVPYDFLKFVLGPIIINSFIFLPLLCLIGFYNDTYNEKIPLKKIVIISIIYLSLLFFMGFITSIEHTIIPISIYLMFLGIIAYVFDLSKNQIGIKVYKYFKNTFPLSIKLYLGLIVFIAILSTLLSFTGMDKLLKNNTFSVLQVIAILLTIVIYSFFTKKNLSKITSVKTSLYYNLFIFGFLYSDLVQQYFSFLDKAEVFKNSIFYEISVSQAKIFLYLYNIITIYSFICSLIVTIFLIFLTNQIILKYINSKIQSKIVSH